MDCLVLPVSSILRKSGLCSRLGYRPLTEDSDFGELQNLVTVVVGKEKKEFLVDPFVLQENPFRALIKILNSNGRKQSFDDSSGMERVVFVDVDSILFEHMLWLLYNDSSSLFNLNLEEIIDFYAQDN